MGRCVVIVTQISQLKPSTRQNRSGTDQLLAGRPAVDAGVAVVVHAQPHPRYLRPVSGALSERERERERERESVCVCERERESVCLRECVRSGEGEGEGEEEGEGVRVRVRVRVGVRVRVRVRECAKE